MKNKVEIWLHHKNHKLTKADRSLLWGHIVSEINNSSNFSYSDLGNFKTITTNRGGVIICVNSNFISLDVCFTHVRYLLRNIGLPIRTYELFHQERASDL